MQLIAYNFQEEDLEAFKRAFQIFDTDGSGKMNFTEVDKLIVELSNGQDPTDEEVLEVRQGQKSFRLRKSLTSLAYETAGSGRERNG